MYNVELAMKAQKKYCEETHTPYFAPHDGCCFRCGHQIYAPTISKYGYTVGVTVEYAANNLVTSCPYCNASFVE